MYFLRKIFLLSCCFMVSVACVNRVIAETAVSDAEGVYLLLKAETVDVKIEYMDRLWPILRDALRAERDTLGGIKRERRESGALHVLISEISGVERAWEIASATLASAPNLFDLASPKLEVKVEGSRLVVDFSQADSEHLSRAIADATIIAMQERIDAFELEQSEVSLLEDGVMRYIGFEKVSVEQLAFVLQAVGRITVRPIVSKTADKNQDPGAGNDLLPMRGDPATFFVVERRDVVSDKDFIGFESTFDLNGGPAVSFSLNEIGAEALDTYIRGSLGSLTAFVLDDEVISIMQNQVKIPPHEGLIAGRFNSGYIEALVKILDLDALPAGIEILQYRDIGAPIVLRE